jgi:hypothetical protein
MEFLQWYFDYSPGKRFLIALVPLAISTIMYFSGMFWPWGRGVGTILLCCSFPTDGERNKWGDW